MRSTKFIIIIITILIFIMISFVWAQPPQLLNYQGRLTDETSEPLDGNYTMQFLIYSEVSGGSPIWTETQTLVAVSNGVFNVKLGSEVPLPQDLFSGTGDRYLETKVGAETLAPRFRFTSVAYSFKAIYSDTAGVAVPEGSAGGDLSGEYPDPTVAKIQGQNISVNAPSDGYVLKWNSSNSEWEPAVDESGGTVNTTERLNGDGTVGSPLDIAQQEATTNQVLKWDGSAWTPAADSAGGPPEGPAGGDLSGAFPNPSVAKIQGLSISVITPDDGQILKWNATNSEWEPSVDLSGGTVNTTARLSGDGTVGSPLDIASQDATTDQVLQWNGSAWVPGTINVSGGNTLDQAYDQGGEGAGRTITADNGAVNITGTDGLIVSGTVAATTFSGSGASLSNLNASNLSSGTVPNAVLDLDLVDLVDGSLTGSKVGTGIIATNVTSGTLANSLLDTDLQDLADGSLTGSKVGTGINAANISTGILPGGRISGTYANILTFSNASNNFTGSFTGNGSGLTGLPTGPWNTSGSNIYFNTGLVGIGVSSPTYPLIVSNSSGSYTSSIYASKSGVTGGSYAIRGINSSAPNSGNVANGGNFIANANAAGIKYGVQANAYGTGTQNIGGVFTATGATSNYGVYAQGDYHYFNGNVGIGQLTATYPLTIAPGTSSIGAYMDHNQTASGNAFGMYIDLDNTYASSAYTYGLYSNTLKNGGSYATYGVYGSANGNSTGAKYGVYGSASGSGNLFAGYFAGDVEVTQDITADRLEYSSPRTHYYSVGGEHFYPNSSVEYSNGGGNGGAYITSLGYHWLLAPVHLPDGATITRFTVYYYDTNASTNITIYLQSLHIATSGYTFNATINTVGSAGYSSAYTLSIASPVVNNSTNAYNVRVYGNWPGDASLRIMGAVITYTISEAE